MKLKFLALVFSLSFLLSLPLWFGANILSAGAENYFFWQEVTKDPKLLSAQMSQALAPDKKIGPVRIADAQDLDISAETVLSVYVGENARKNLFCKNSSARLPIASLTKLMTALISVENYGLDETIQISKQAVKTEEETGNFKAGEIFTVKDLLFSLLIESSNDAAFALAEKMGLPAFVELMNREAKNIGMENTFFENPIGLDPDKKDAAYNYSTASDLLKLTEYLMKNQRLIKYIFGLPQYELYAASGVFHHKIITTNDFLTDNFLTWQNKIIGGKTGTTLLSKECMLLVVQAPDDKGYIVNIILGAPDKFVETKKLVEWTFSAFNW